MLLFFLLCLHVSVAVLPALVTINKIGLRFFFYSCLHIHSIQVSLIVVGQSLFPAETKQLAGLPISPFNSCLPIIWFNPHSVFCVNQWSSQSLPRVQVLGRLAVSGVKAGSLVGVLVTRFGLGSIQFVLVSYIPGLEQDTPVLVLGIFMVLDNQRPHTQVRTIII